MNMLKSKWEIPWQLGRKTRIHAYRCCLDSRVLAGQLGILAFPLVTGSWIISLVARWLWLVTRTILEILRTGLSLELSRLIWLS
jgi:hypothetical protein